jgi:hypothetical protein
LVVGSIPTRPTNQIRHLRQAPATKALLERSVVPVIVPVAHGTRWDAQGSAGRKWHGVKSARRDRMPLDAVTRECAVALVTSLDVTVAELRRTRLDTAVLAQAGR